MPPREMRPTNGKAVTQTRSAGRTGILVAQARDSSRRQCGGEPFAFAPQTHRAMPPRNRERMSIDAFTACGDDVSVRKRHLPQVVTKSAEQVAMRAASGYPIVRFGSYGRAGDRVGLGTERSVAVYGMNRRSRDRESQPGTRACSSVGDPFMKRRSRCARGKFHG